MSDGCETSVGVHGVMTGSAWRPGVDQEGVAKRFKLYALDRLFRTGPLPPPYLRFVPPALVGKGSYGCADLGIGHEIAPGKSVRAAMVWDGSASMRWGPPPTGLVTITGTFDHYWRGNKQPSSGQWQTLEVKLETWVADGADPTRLSPPEVADAALADPAFAAYLETLDLGNGNEVVMWYRPARDLWEVGVLDWYGGPGATMHLVLIDPDTGAVMGTVDRPWDRDADGFP
jgi:hypothetical protein